MKKDLRNKNSQADINKYFKINLFWNTIDIYGSNWIVALNKLESEQKQMKNYFTK